MRDFGFLSSEAKSQLFSLVVFVLAVLVLLVRACLVGEEGVEPTFRDELSRPRTFQTNLTVYTNIVGMFNCFETAFGLEQGYPIA